MPTEQDSHNRAHKFPFVANEVFSSDVAAIQEMFFSSSQSLPAEWVPELRLKQELQPQTVEDKPTSDEEDLVLGEEIEEDGEPSDLDFGSE